MVDFKEKSDEILAAMIAEELLSTHKPGDIPVEGLSATDKVAFDYRQMAEGIAADIHMGDPDDDDEIEATIVEILDDYDEYYVNVVVRWEDGSFSFHPHTRNTTHGVFWAIDHGLAFPIGAEVKIALMPDMTKEVANDHGVFFDTDMEKDGFMESIAFFAGDVPKHSHVPE